MTRDERVARAKQSGRTLKQPTPPKTTSKKSSKKRRPIGEMPRIREDVWEMLDKESDRGAILVGVAYLDELLSEALSARIVAKDPKWEEALFKMDGAAGTLSRKIDLAAAFGFIDEHTAEVLHTLREIRNSAAHFDRKHGAGFSVAFDSAHVSRLLTKIGGESTDQDFRGRFIRRAIYTMGVLYSSQEFGEFQAKHPFGTRSEFLGFVEQRKANDEREPADR